MASEFSSHHLKITYVQLWQQLILEFDLLDQIGTENGELICLGFSDQVDRAVKRFDRLCGRLLRGDYSDWPEMIRELLEDIAGAADNLIELLENRGRRGAYIIPAPDGRLDPWDEATPTRVEHFLDKINPIRLEIVTDAKRHSMDHEEAPMPEVGLREPDVKGSLWKEDRSFRSNSSGPEGDSRTVQAKSKDNQQDEDRNPQRRQKDIRDFIEEVLQVTGTKITKKDIWTAAGYTDRTEFQRFQKGSGRATESATKNFMRILSEDPKKFVDRLNRKRYST